MELYLSQVWEAYIVKNNRQRSLGLYEDENLAAIAYNKAAAEMFGEYAYLNKIPEGYEECIESKIEESK